MAAKTGPVRHTDRAASSAVQPPPQRAGRARSLTQWLARWALRALEVLVGLVLAAVLLESLLEYLDRQRLPVAGKIIAVAGAPMHLSCVGERKANAAAVILEGGLGATAAMWARIQAAVAAHAQVCAYDRAGMGASARRSGPRDAAHIARQLHALLAAGGVPAPYVLVGHSFGGLYARVFAGAFPADVQGLVLLEATHPDQYSATPEGRAEYQRLQKVYSAAPWLARLGLMRYLPYCDAPAGFPAAAAASLHAACAAAGSWNAQAAELDSIGATVAQVQGAALPPNMPVAVVAGGAHVAASASWQQAQRELSLLTARATYQVIAGGTHSSVWQDADQAGLCAAAILVVVYGG